MWRVVEEAREHKGGKKERNKRRGEATREDTEAEEKEVA